MTKKKDFKAQAQNMASGAFDPAAATADKLPSDIRSGKEALTSFMNIPVEKLVPYRSKGGFDFSRHDEGLKSAMAESIRQYGVIEPLSVRPTGSGDTYEILAGESRWLAAREAGLEKVPCHVLKVGDDEAEAVFSATNLMRRDLSYRDRINGWWRYLESVKRRGMLGSLRSVMLGTDAGEDGEDGPEAEALEEAGPRVPGGIGWRQIMRYYACHSLLDEWVDRLDRRRVPFMTAYVVSQFPQDVQTLLLDYRFSESQAKQLLEIYQRSARGEEGAVWEGVRTIEEVLSAPAPSPALPRGARSRILKAVQTGVHPEDMDRVDEVLSQALQLYYRQQEALQATQEDSGAAQA